MAATNLDPKRTAVLLMDFQSDVLSMLSREPEMIIGRVASVLNAARKRGAAVIHANLAFRAGHPEICARNDAMVAAFKSRNAFVADATGNATPQAAMPHPTDIQIVKRRIGAFHGTELDMVLRAREIDTLVLMGLATSGAVLSTVRHAFDADYRMIVLRDCCLDPDVALHDTLFDRVISRQAAVMTSNELAAMLA